MQDKMFAAMQLEDYLHVLRLMSLARPLPVYAQIYRGVHYDSQQMLIVVSYKLENIGFEFVNFIDLFSFSYRYNCYTDTSSNNIHC